MEIMWERTVIACGGVVCPPVVASFARWGSVLCRTHAGKAQCEDECR